MFGKLGLRLHNMAHLWLSINDKNLNESFQECLKIKIDTTDAKKFDAEKFHRNPNVVEIFRH